MQINKQDGMEKIGIFYGPSKGSVAKVAELLAQEIGNDNVELILVKEATTQDVNRFKKIIFGLSTIGKANWNSYYKDTDWDVFMTIFETANWKNKTIAIYGLGDQLTYPDNFVDGIGWLYERLEKFDTNIVGSCNTEGYQFNESNGLRNGRFLGLPIDEDNEPELTLTRVKNWIDQLKTEGF